LWGKAQALIVISYIVRRILLGVLILAGVSIFTFLLTRVVPSNPAARWIGPHATAEQIAAARIELGLDRPLHVQYSTYVRDFFRGDWGVSIRTHQPVFKEIFHYLPASLELIITGMLLAIVIGLPLGALSAAHSCRPVDHVSRVFAIIGVGIPTFWLGMILQLVFFKHLGWFPLAERIDIMIRLAHPIKQITGFYLFDSLITGNIAAFGSAATHLVLPAITLAAFPLGLTTRMTRATMLEVLNEDYIRTSRAYGAHEVKIIVKYALRNAIGPVLTVIALAFAYSLVETFLIESVFVWPGLGYYASKGIMAVDYPVIMGVTFLIASVYVIINLIVDISLALMDPRISVD